MPIRRYLPRFTNQVLFGDRRYEKIRPDENDPDWFLWQQTYREFYTDTQKMGIGNYVNERGYQIFNSINLNGKRVFELGPGILPHMKFWRGNPEIYYLGDVKEEFLALSKQILEREQINTQVFVTDSGIPMEPCSCDIVVSFYCLEHITNLPFFLQEISRILTPGGIFIGGIPTDGGIMWGLSRAITTRRYLKKRGINPDKVIPWEHVHFADYILNELKNHFKIKKVKYWPLKINMIDLNLIISFICLKK